MVDIDLWQRAAVALDEWACGGDKGRDKRDPVYLSVVENRDGLLVPYNKYSSCGDRAHWRLWRLGVRAPFVNREERSPLPHDWHVGMNIAQLHSHGAPCMPGRPGADWVPEPGDEMLIWNSPTGNDAHSLSVLSYDPETHTARTANYGTAGMSMATFPGSQCKVVPLTWTATEGWKCGRRLVQRVTKLANVIPLITAKPNLSGPEDWTDTWTGEVKDLLESYRD